jgi:hypothetical protein
MPFWTKFFLTENFVLLLPKSKMALQIKTVTNQKSRDQKIKNYIKIVFKNINILDFGFPDQFHH